MNLSALTRDDRHHMRRTLECLIQGRTYEPDGGSVQWARNILRKLWKWELARMEEDGSQGGDRSASSASGD